MDRLELKDFKDFKKKVNAFKPKYKVDDLVDINLSLALGCIYREYDLRSKPVCMIDGRLRTMSRGVVVGEITKCVVKFYNTEIKATYCISIMIGDDKLNTIFLRDFPEELVKKSEKTSYINDFIPDPIVSEIVVRYEDGTEEIKKRGE